MRRMANVDKHPKAGFYRVRLTYPQHLRGILKATSVTKSLGTRDATSARKKAIPLLATFQRQISDAEAIHGAQKTGEVAPVLLTLAEGIRLIDDWRDAYLARSVTVLTTWTGRAGDYLAVGETPERDRAILSADPTLMVRLYYADQPVPGDILNRTLDRILATAHYTSTGASPVATCADWQPAISHRHYSQARGGLERGRLEQRQSVCDCSRPRTAAYGCSCGAFPSRHPLGRPACRSH